MQQPEGSWILQVGVCSYGARTFCTPIACAMGGGGHETIRSEQELGERRQSVTAAAPGDQPAGFAPETDRCDHVLADSELHQRIGAGESLAIGAYRGHALGEPSVAEWKGVVAGEAVARRFSKQRLLERQRGSVHGQRAGSVLVRNRRQITPCRPRSPHHQPVLPALGRRPARSSSSPLSRPRWRMSRTDGRSTCVRPCKWPLASWRAGEGRRQRGGCSVGPSGNRRPPASGLLHETRRRIVAGRRRTSPARADRSRCRVLETRRTRRSAPRLPQGSREARHREADRPTPDATSTRCSSVALSSGSAAGFPCRSRRCGIGFSATTPAPCRSTSSAARETERARQRGKIVGLRRVSRFGFAFLIP